LRPVSVPACVLLVLCSSEEFGVSAILFSRQQFYSVALLCATLLATSTAYAHVSEQGLVLLLPTNVYITTGVLAVVLTIVLLALVPARWTHKLFATKSPVAASACAQKTSVKHTDAIAHSLPRNIPSVLSALLLFALLYVGYAGSHDPLENPLPLFIWTIWWVGFVVLQGVAGNLWQSLNPWTGLYRLTCHLIKPTAPRQLPKRLGVWPGVATLLLFTMFALADIAPDAPGRLAGIVGLYWLFTLIAMFVFGEQWLHRCECFSMLLRRYAQLAMIGQQSGTIRFGFPGWRAYACRAKSISGAIFVLVLLGSGSFDGLNETFSWLAFINVNPLEFPGRSAVVDKTILGIVAANILLVAIYAVCIFAGTHWANTKSDLGNKVSYHQAFCQLAIAILPIAFAYHFAHFLTAFMINAQYALAAVSDPLDKGADLLNLGTFYVTTGFMNSHHTVEAIWLTQALAVVAGHVLSVMLAHAIALDLFGSARRAIISQAPLAAFMVAYTFMGLWLLAAPRGA